MFIGIVFVEILLVFFRHQRCPLTPISACFTADCRDNFDIYFSKWIARYYKMIFGVLYTVGLLYTLARWWSWLR
jgi:hypothetical protein